MYEDLAEQVEKMPEDDWCGLFREVRTALVTACYMLRSARAGEPLCISWGEKVNAIQLVCYKVASFEQVCRISEPISVQSSIQL